MTVRGRGYRVIPVRPGAGRAQPAPPGPGHLRPRQHPAGRCRLAGDLRARRAATCSANGAPTPPGRRRPTPGSWTTSAGRSPTQVPELLGFAGDTGRLDPLPLPRTGSWYSAPGRGQTERSFPSRSAGTSSSAAGERDQSYHSAGPKLVVGIPLGAGDAYFEVFPLHELARTLGAVRLALIVAGAPDAPRQPGPRLRRAGQDPGAGRRDRPHRPGHRRRRPEPAARGGGLRGAGRPRRSFNRMVGVPPRPDRARRPLRLQRQPRAAIPAHHPQVGRGGDAAPRRPPRRAEPAAAHPPRRGGQPLRGYGHRPARDLPDGRLPARAPYGARTSG